MQLLKNYYKGNNQFYLISAFKYSKVLINKIANFVVIFLDYKSVSCVTLCITPLCISSFIHNIIICHSYSLMKLNAFNSKNNSNMIVPTYEITKFSFYFKPFKCTIKFIHIFNNNKSK